MLWCVIIGVIFVVGSAFGLEQQACLGERIQMFCTAGQVVVVEQAVYGVIEGNPCNSSTLNPCLSNQAIVTVNRQCTGTPGCGFIVRHSQFTGLCPQDNNALLVKYRCVSDQSMYRICEHSSQQISPQEGYISSHMIGGPPTYPSSQLCRVTIPFGGTAQYVSVDVLELSLETTPGGSGCVDYLKLTDSNSPANSDTLCGEIYDLSSKSMNFSSLTIEFSSDASDTATNRGFLLHYTVHGFRPAISQTVSSSMSSTLLSQLPPISNTAKQHVTTTTSLPSLPGFQPPHGTVINGSWASACFGQMFSLSCALESVIVIREGRYGVFGGSMCKPDTVREVCMSQAALLRLNDYCSGRQSCVMQVDTTFGFCPEAYSELSAKYECVKKSNVVDICGTGLQPNTENNYVMSPNYPEHYGQNKHCSKVVNPGSDHYIDVSVYDISLESRHSSSRCVDFLTISDPENPMKNQQFCGDILSPSLVLRMNINVLNLTFYSDGLSGSSAVTYRGFLLQYNVLPRPVMTSQITSTTTNLPAQRGNCKSSQTEGICKVKCNSLSTVLFCDFDHSLVLLKVLFGSLEPSDMAGCPGTTNNVSCPAVDFTNQLIKSCSGRMNCLVDPTNFQQCNPLSRVALKTDYKCAHNSDIIDICGTSTLVQPKGYIKSPDYPKQYSSSSDCSRSINPGYGKLIKITVYDISTPNITSGVCSDYVKIHDTNNATYTYCGTLSSVKEPLEIVVDNVNITFSSDYNQDSGFRGFIIGYEIIEKEIEHTTLLNPVDSVTTLDKQWANFSMTSPPPPTTSKPTVTTSPSPSSVSCNATQPGGYCSIKCTRQSSIKLQCESLFALYVYGAFYDTSLANVNSLCQRNNISKTCVSNDVTRAISKTCSGRTSCTIPAEMDYSACTKENDSPLIIHYKCIFQALDICSSHVLPNEGFIASPLYPNNYPTNSNCQRHLKPSSFDAFIEVRLISLELEARPTTQGCYDKLIFKETQYGNIIKYYEYCGTLDTTSNPVQVNYSSVTVEFISDGFTQNMQGFLFYFTVKSTNSSDVYLVSDILTPPVTTLSPPGTMSETSSTLSPAETKTQTSSTSDFTTTWPNVNTLNTSTTIDICSTAMLPNEGILTSPLYPEPYPANRQCERNLKPSNPNATILVWLLDLDMEQRATQVGCYDKLILSGPNSAQYYEYCGLYTTISMPKKLQFKELSVTFYSDSWTQTMTGFSLYYRVESGSNESSVYIIPDVSNPQPTTTTTVQMPSTTQLPNTTGLPIIDICSSTYFANEGLISSPMYPNYYPISKNCERHLTPSHTDALLQVQLIELDLTARPTQGCYDKLILNELGNPSKYHVYCGTLKTSTEPVSMNYTKLVVTFISDDFTDNRKGFLLYYKLMTVSTVDKVYILPDTTTRSPPTMMSTSPTQASTTHITLPGSAFTVSLCIGETFQKSCTDPNDIIVIQDAKFGNFVNNLCGGPTVTTSQICDTTIKLSLVAACTGFTTCSFTVDQQNVPQNCMSTSTLTVTYSCYKAPVDICSNEPLTKPEGLVSSNNYPSQYSHVTCSKTLTPSAPTAYILTKIYDLDLEARTTSVGCYDHLYMEEPLNPSNYFDYCGNLLNSPYSLKQRFSKLKITFRPDQQTHKKGFLIYYRVVGGITTTVTTPIVTSSRTTFQTNSTLKSPESTDQSIHNHTTIPQPTSTQTSSTLTPQPTSSTLTPQPTSSTLTPKPTSSTLTPKPTSSTLTPQPTSNTFAPQTMSSTLAPQTTSTQIPSTPTSLNTSSSISATNSTPASGSSTVVPTGTVLSNENLNGALVTGLVLAGILLLALTALIMYAFIRKHRTQKATVLKPGQRDLFANTHGAHITAMNEYTYVDMNQPLPYDTSAQLAAHESALSSPLYDSNRNRNFSNPVPGERIVTVTGEKQLHDTTMNCSLNSDKHNGITASGVSSPSTAEELYPVDYEEDTSFSTSVLNKVGLNNGPDYPPPPPPDIQDDVSLSDEQLKVMENGSPKTGNLEMQDKKPTTYETFSDA